MDKETEKKALKALERQRKQFKYQNEYIAQNYDRQTVTLPKGTKDRIKQLGFTSVNGFINDLVRKELERLESENK